MGPENSNQNWFRSRRFWMGVVIIVILIGAFKCWHYGGYYRGPGTNNDHVVAVSGHGEVFAAPDIATFSFSALGRASTVPEAQAQMTKVANAAMDYLKKAGVDEKDIQTTDYSVNPTYKYESAICTRTYCPPSGTPTITGYEVMETVTVKLRDTTKSGEILGGVGNLGVSNISGLSFTIDNPDALKEKARKMAIDKAKAAADLLGKDLGVHLKRIVSFTESGNNPIPFAYDAKALSAGAPASVPTPEIATGQNKITSDVTITYEIR